VVVLGLKVAFTSGSKGGTGKSTLSSLCTLALAGAGYSVLLVDCGSEGNSTRMLLRNPRPPFLRDFLKGDLWALGEYTVKVGSFEVNFFMIPNIGPLDRLDRIRSMLNLKLSKARLEDYFQLIVFDLPAYQGSSYDAIIDASDIVVLVAKPYRAAVAAVKTAYTGRAKKLVVLNEYHPSFIEYRVDMERYFNDSVLTLPYDPYVRLMGPDTLSLVLSRLGKEFQRSLLELCRSILMKGGIYG